MAGPKTERLLRAAIAYCKRIYRDGDDGPEDVEYRATAALRKAAIAYARSTGVRRPPRRDYW